MTSGITYDLYGLVAFPCCYKKRIDRQGKKYKGTLTLWCWSYRCPLIVVTFVLTGGCMATETLLIFSKVRISNCLCKCYKYDVDVSLL